jgi:hypothetical protein
LIKIGEKFPIVLRNWNNRCDARISGHVAQVQCRDCPRVLKWSAQIRWRPWRDRYVHPKPTSERSNAAIGFAQLAAPHKSDK